MNPKGLGTDWPCPGLIPASLLLSAQIGSRLQNTNTRREMCIDRNCNSILSSKLSMFWKFVVFSPGYTDGHIIIVTWELSLCQAATKAPDNGPVLESQRSHLLFPAWKQSKGTINRPIMRAEAELDHWFVFNISSSRLSLFSHSDWKGHCRKGQKNVSHLTQLHFLSVLKPASVFLLSSAGLPCQHLPSHVTCDSWISLYFNL